MLFFITLYAKFSVLFIKHYAISVWNPWNPWNPRFQKYLGARLGFDEKSVDVRIAQYESGTRSPKDNYLALLADTLGVSPLALSVPNIDSYDGLMHTLFALEDIYGFKITNIDGDICLSLKKFDNPSYPQLFDNFTAWYEQANKLREGLISKEEYDDWRYHYSMANSSGISASSNTNH